jgi:hypothetical protein
VSVIHPFGCARQMTYDLRRLRLDGLIRRIERVKT